MHVFVISASFNLWWQNIEEPDLGPSKQRIWTSQIQSWTKSKFKNTTGKFTCHRANTKKKHLFDEIFKKILDPKPH